jgi:hypothetical protein
MKSKFYFVFLLVISLSFNLSAQNFQYGSMIEEDWVKSTWVYSYKTENTYNSKGILSQTNSYEWDTINNVPQWVKYYIMTNTISANSTIAESLTQSYDSDQKKWVDASKEIFTYDANKNMLTRTYNMNMGTSWIGFSSTTYEYNASNQLIKETDKSLDYMSMTLVTSGQTTYTYNADGTENQTIDQKWDKTTSAWINTYRNTYTYSSKKVISYLEETYQGSVWINYYKTAITWNGDKYVETQDYKWNTTTNVWENKYKDIVTYSGSNISLVLNQAWDTKTSAWVNDSRMTYTPVTGIEQPALAGENLARVYPNPFEGEINIESNGMTTTRYQVFNSAGQMVYSTVADRTRTRLNLNSLERGTYFLKMSSGNIQQTVKLMKIH